MEPASQIRCGQRPPVKSRGTCKSLVDSSKILLTVPPLLSILLLLQLLASQSSTASLAHSPVQSSLTSSQHHSFQVSAAAANRSGMQLLEARRRLISTPPTVELPSEAHSLRPDTRPPPQVNGSVQGEEKVEEVSLHFGAKVALALLSFVIFLVAAATLLDYKLSSTTSYTRSQNHLGRLHGSQSSLTGKSPDQTAMRAQQQQLRDQRSPSLSSSSSCSTLLCSTVSSTTPILTCMAARNAVQNGPPNRQRHDEPRQQVSWLRRFQLRQKSLRCQLRSSAKPASSKPPQLSVEMNAGDEVARPQAEQVQAQAREDEQWRRKLMLNCDNEATNQTPDSTCSYQFMSNQLSQQLLLAFSLKQTARNIFRIPQKGERSSFACKATGKQHLGTSTNMHHQTRTCFNSLSRISENDKSDHNSSLAVGASNHSKPCIESLHGLRCLSMIWIIVVHSYHFALKSLFAPPGPTNLYKTIVSQLLANGSFACDSFFFAAGFLLAYLALPPKQSATSTSAGRSLTKSEQHQNQQDCDSISSLGSASDSAGRGTKEQQHQEHICAGGGGASNQNRYHLNNIVICHSNQFKLTDKSCSLATSTPSTLNSGTRSEFTLSTLLSNLLHRYIRMMPLMMAIIGLSASLLRYLGEGPLWEDSTLMYDKWCRKNWWINALFIHNFLKRENMCLSHSWYAAVDIQLFTLGQLILFVLFRSKKLGLLLCTGCLLASQLINGASTLIYHLPAVPLVANVSEQTMNLYYGLIYIKPYCRASPYLIGILLAFLMRRTSLRYLRLKKWQVILGWTLSLCTLVGILLAMRPAMNGTSLSLLQSTLYSSLSRPLWACAVAWMIYACITGRGGPFACVLEARCFFPLSQLSYPAFLIHPIVIAIFYGSHQAHSFQFSHYLMLYIIIGNIVITYTSAFLLSALFEFPLLSLERTIKRAYRSRHRVIK